MEDNRQAAARQSRERGAIDGQARLWPGGAVVLMLSLTVADEPALASGYALREQSATALGNAMAGATAGAEDLSYMFFNPAALTRLSGNQLLGATHVIVPHLEMKDVSASTGGISIGGGNGGSNAGEDGVVPVFYGMWDTQQSLQLDKNIKMGLGVNVPFGVRTDYDDGWAGRYHALHSKVLAVNVNPAVAWEVFDGLSVGAGLQAQYFDARLTNAIDFGSIGQALGGVPTQQDGTAKATGDGWGYGFNLGVLYEPWQGTRFGAAYRSAIHHTLKGNGNFQLDAAGTGQRLVGATGGLSRHPHQGEPDHAGDRLVWGLPRSLARVGGHGRGGLDALEPFPQPHDQVQQPGAAEQRDGRRLAGHLVLRARSHLATGRALDAARRCRVRPGPEPQPYANPATSDRRPLLAVARGGLSTVRQSDLRLRLHARVHQDTSIDLTADQPGNQVRGNLSGKVEGTADVFGVQASWVF